MQNVRVALLQYAWQGSFEATAAVVRPLAAQAASAGAELLCLPEFSLLPYFPGTRDPAGFAWAEDAHDGRSAQFFAALAREHGLSVIGSLYERDGDAFYDTATVHAPGGALVGHTRKVHIPSGEGYHETDFFGGGTAYPVHDLGAVRLAAPTCYDQWFPELARIYALNGAEFIFYPTAIGSEPTAPDVDSAESWQTVMRGHAIANGVFVGAANRVGVENGVTFYGSSFVADPTGRVLAQAGRASTEVLIADLDAAGFARWRALFPLLAQRAPATYQRLLDASDMPLPGRFAARTPGDERAE